MTALVIDVVGWAGAALILAAYALLTLGKVRAESFAYQAMNLLGAAAS